MKRLFPALIAIFALIAFLISCSAPTSSNPVSNQRPKFVSAQPANGATDVATTTTLSWVFIDPDNDPLAYQVRISTDKGDLGEFVKVAGNSYKYNLEPSKTYYWEVRATDPSGNTTSSGTLSFSTVIGPPKKPELLSPVNEMKDVDYQKVEFYWKCADRDPTMVFELYVNDEKKVETTRTDYTLYNLQPNVKYEWYVIVRNNAGKAQSETFNFTTAMSGRNRTPTVPIAISPPDGAKSVNMPVTLEWRCEDPDGDVLYFNVYVNNQLKTQETTATCYELAGLDANTKYEWYVEVTDKKIGSPIRSPNWTFTTKGVPNRAPEKPNNPSPQMGEIVQQTDVVLKWSCSDPDGDKLFYDVYFGESSNPQLIRENIETNFVSIQDLKIGRKYYWKVVAKDGNSETEGDMWHFVVLSQAAGSRFLALTESGVYEVDASDVSSPTYTKRLSNTGDSVYYFDETIYVIGDEGLIIDTITATPVNFPGDRIIVSQLQPILRVVVGDLYAIITTGPSLTILNVQDPSNVDEVISIPASSSEGIFVDGSTIYLCDGNKLRIIEAISPESPLQLGEYTLDSTSGKAIETFVVEDTAYLLAEYKLLKLDVSNPAAIIKEDDTSFTGKGVKIYYDSGFVFVLTDCKLCKFDDQLTKVEDLDLTGGASLLVRSGYVYVGTSSGIKIFDINLEPVKHIDIGRVKDMCFTDR